MPQKSRIIWRDEGLYDKDAAFSSGSYRIRPLKRGIIRLLGRSMLFMHPMWDNESQRIGKQKCTPIGYTLHAVAELVGFVGLLLLLILLIVLVWKEIAGTFQISLLWLLMIPFSFGIISELLYQYSWKLALRKGFHYDYELREASWIEAGERRFYKYPA
jgi:hypothetical protein